MDHLQLETIRYFNYLVVLSIQEILFFIGIFSKNLQRLHSYFLLILFKPIHELVGFSNLYIKFTFINNLHYLF